MGRKIPITPEQEALPISKYYHREPAPIPAESWRCWPRAPAIPAAQLDIHHRNDLFLSGLPAGRDRLLRAGGRHRLRCESYGHARRHSGDVRLVVRLARLRPPALYHMGPGGPHRRRVPQLWTGPLRRPVMKERYWGTTHIIREDIGMGARRALCQLPGTPRAGL